MFANYADEPSCEKCGKQRSWSLMAAQRVTRTGVSYVCFECWYKPEPWWRRLWRRLFRV